MSCGSFTGAEISSDAEVDLSETLSDADAEALSETEALSDAITDVGEHCKKSLTISLAITKPLMNHLTPEAVAMTSEAMRENRHKKLLSNGRRAGGP